MPCPTFQVGEPGRVGRRVLRLLVSRKYRVHKRAKREARGGTSLERVVEEFGVSSPQKGGRGACPSS